MFLITSINGSEGAWMQKSKQKTTIGDSLDQQCQQMSEAFEGLSPNFDSSIIMINDGHPACLALQLFWVSNYSLFINNNISWVFFLFLTIENERLYCNLVIVVNGLHKHDLNEVKLNSTWKRNCRRSVKLTQIIEITKWMFNNNNNNRWI